MVTKNEEATTEEQNIDEAFTIDPQDDLMLTTIDNPFNPKTHYPQWKTWDYENGYFTEEYIARIANIPPHVDVDDDLTISRYVNQAINSILENDTIGSYKLV